MKERILFYISELQHYVTTENGRPQEVRIDFNAGKRELRLLDPREAQIFRAAVKRQLASRI